MSRRTDRVASILQRELAMIIIRDLEDPRLVGMPSITRVKVSEDLSSADVYVTIMGTEGKQSAALNALKHSAGMMRSRLSADLEMRQVPFLKFHIDENLKKEREVLDLLRRIENEREAREPSSPEDEDLPSDEDQGPTEAPPKDVSEPDGLS